MKFDMIKTVKVKGLVNMYIKRYLKKRFMISTISVIAILLVISVSSYALFMDVRRNVVDQVLAVGDLQITFLDNITPMININTNPMTDEEARGRDDNVYIFTIENIGNLAYHYSVSLNRVLGNTFPPQFIRYSINNLETEVLSKATDGIIFEGVLDPGSLHRFELRIWVGSGNQSNPVLGLPNEILGSAAVLDLEVYGRAGFEGDEGPEEGSALPLTATGDVNGYIDEMVRVRGVVVSTWGDIFGTHFGINDSSGSVQVSIQWQGQDDFEIELGNVSEGECLEVIGWVDSSVRIMPEVTGGRVRAIPC